MVIGFRIEVEVYVNIELEGFEFLRSIICLLFVSESWSSTGS